MPKTIKELMPIESRWKYGGTEEDREKRLRTRRHLQKSKENYLQRKMDRMPSNKRNSYNAKNN